MPTPRPSATRGWPIAARFLDLPPEVEARFEHLPNRLNEYGFDDWGLSLESARAAMRVGYWFYRRYFRVIVEGAHHVPSGRCVLVGNHGGQLPIDAAMTSVALFVEPPVPRIARAMIERWLPQLPFLGTAMRRSGSIVGNPEDCRRLLQNDEAVLVFPEGARGSSKTIWHRYELQPFGTGFLRLALEADAPIVPVGIVGSEEQLPCLFKIPPPPPLGALGVPFFPVVPQLVPIPLPTRYRITFGEPLRLRGSAEDDDEALAPLVDEVRDAMRSLIQHGRARRMGLFR